MNESKYILVIEEEGSVVSIDPSGRMVGTLEEALTLKENMEESLPTYTYNVYELEKYRE